MGNLGPLPTDFTINANCASELDDAYLLHTPVSGHDAYYLLRGPLDQTTCFPSGYTANTEQYYSPGRCPTGYTAPCQSINRAGTVEETVLTCCPTQGNYICQTDTGHPWETTQGCASKFTTSTQLTLSEVSNGVTSRATTTFDQVDAINAYSIQVRYQSTDFISTPSSSPTPVSSVATETSSSTSTPHSTNSNANKAIPGIVVGVLAAVLIVIGAIFLLVRRRHRRRQQQQQPTLTQQIQHPYPYPYQPNYQEQQQHQQLQYFSLSKVNPDNPQELDARERIAELDSGVTPPRSGGQDQVVGEDHRHRPEQH